jgi:SAM-dependent methyltransferase
MKKQKQASTNTTGTTGTSHGEEALFDPLASVYDEWFETDGKLIFATEVKAFQEILSSLPKPWVEIGVGSGRFAHALGIEIGLDPSTKLLEIARKRGITTFLGKGEQQPFDTASFGTAFLIVTFCFVHSPLDVLKETWRILAPGGKIVLGLVLRESPWGRFYEQKKKEGHRFYKYANFYNYDEVVTLLEQVGLLVETFISTLFQKPGEVEQVELPRNGFSPAAGFVIIVAGEKASEGASLR